MFKRIQWNPWGHWLMESMDSPMGRNTIRIRLESVVSKLVISDSKSKYESIKYTQKQNSNNGEKHNQLNAAHLVPHIASLGKTCGRPFLGSAPSSPKKLRIYKQSKQKRSSNQGASSCQTADIHNKQRQATPTKAVEESAHRQRSPIPK